MVFLTFDRNVTADILHFKYFLKDFNLNDLTFMVIFFFFRIGTITRFLHNYFLSNQDPRPVSAHVHLERKTFTLGIVLVTQLVSCKGRGRHYSMSIQNVCWYKYNVETSGFCTHAKCKCDILMGTVFLEAQPLNTYLWLLHAGLSVPVSFTKTTFTVHLLQLYVVLVDKQIRGKEIVLTSIKLNKKRRSFLTMIRFYLTLTVYLCIAY